VYIGEEIAFFFSEILVIIIALEQMGKMG